jgi:calcium-dependent protein kinase
VAPEVLRREYTNSCDIWSIGVITYILLCGYPPFYGDSDTQIFESVKVGKFDFPSPEWDDISPAAKEFVVQLLKKNSTARPTAADALKHRWLKEQLGTVNKNNKERTMSGASISHTSVRTGEFTKYLAMKKLKKAALGYIASNLTQAEVGTLEEIFQSLDQNRTGHITLTELDEAIEKGKFNAQVLQDLRQLRQDLSLSDEEQMNYRDFLAATMDRSLAMREDNMKKAFDHFKHSSDAGANHLTLQDLSDIFGGEGHAQEIMTLLDHDGDGKVSYEDFRHAVAESMEDEEVDDDQDDDSGFYS